MPYCNFGGQYDLWLAFTHSMFYCKNTVHRQLLRHLIEDCLPTASTLPADWLPTACQLTKDWLPIWFMAGFYAQHVLSQEHCESSTSETFDWGLPDDCQPTLPAICLQTVCQLPASWLKTDYQYGLWLAFMHTIILLQEHWELSTSETFDWILQATVSQKIDNCQTTFS